jgi:hypothetical protein
VVSGGGGGGAESGSGIKDQAQTGPLKCVGVVSVFDAGERGRDRE